MDRRTPAWIPRGESVSARPAFTALNLPTCRSLGFRRAHEQRHLTLVLASAGQASGTVDYILWSRLTGKLRRCCFLIETSRLKWNRAASNSTRSCPN
jgi:hypothetical protein